MAEAEKQALKILHLGKLFPPDQGGIESLTQQLVSDFNELGHKTDVLCANSARQTVVTQSHYTVVRAASWFKLKSVYFAPAIFCWLFRWRNSYDILHVHSPNPLAWLAIFLIRPKGRMIIHWHNDITKQRVLAKLLAPLTNWILNRASAIVVTSENYRNHSTQLYSYLDKVSVIPIYG